MPRTSKPDLLLLDTHVWLWLVAGSPDLSTEARDAINGAAAAGTLRIAAISLWEIALLASRGRTGALAAFADRFGHAVGP